MAEIAVGEPDFLRTEQECDSTRCKVAANEAGTDFQSPQGLLQFTMAYSCGADDQRTVRDGFGNILVLHCSRHQLGGADRRASLAKRYFVRIDKAELRESKVAHGACCSTDVKRVAGGHKDYAQAIKFRREIQGCSFYDALSISSYAYQVVARGGEGARRVLRG